MLARRDLLIYISSLLGVFLFSAAAHAQTDTSWWPSTFYSGEETSVGFLWTIQNGGTQSVKVTLGDLSAGTTYTTDCVTVDSTWPPSQHAYTTKVTITGIGENQPGELYVAEYTDLACSIPNGAGYNHYLGHVTFSVLSPSTFQAIGISSSTVLSPFPTENNWAASSVTAYVNPPTSTNLTGLDYLRSQCNINFLTQIVCWAFMPSVTSTQTFFEQSDRLRYKFPFAYFWSVSSTIATIDTGAAASSSPVGFQLGNQYYATHTIAYFTPSEVASKGEGVFSMIRSVMQSVIGLAWCVWVVQRVRHLDL